MSKENTIKKDGSEYWEKAANELLDHCPDRKFKVKQQVWVNISNEWHPGIIETPVANKKANIIGYFVKLPLVQVAFGDIERALRYNFVPQNKIVDIDDIPVEIINRYTEGG